MISMPPPVTVKAWLQLICQDLTLLRFMENDLIKNIALCGKTLDVGGGTGFSYISHLKIDGQLESVNISPELKPTYIADLNEALPFPDGAYDNVICFNTLEHVYQEWRLMSEMFRVLKPGGRFIFTVPFLFKRHGLYGDFHRHTADFWERALQDLGIDSAAFVVCPLVWCRLSSALTPLDGFRGGIRSHFIKFFILPFELARNLFPAHEKVRQTYKDWALGFYIDGDKTLTGAAGPNR